MCAQETRKLKKEITEVLLRIRRDIIEQTKKHQLKRKATSVLSHLSHHKIELRKKQAITLSTLIILTLISINTLHLRFSPTPTPAFGSASNTVISENTYEAVTANSTDLVPTNESSELPTSTDPNSIIDYSNTAPAWEWNSSVYNPSFYGSLYGYNSDEDFSTSTESFDEHADSDANKTTDTSNTPYYDDVSSVKKNNQKSDDDKEDCLRVSDFDTGSDNDAISDNAAKVTASDTTKPVPIDISPDLPTSPSNVLLSYSSTPIVVDAFVDGVPLQSGESVKVTLGSSMTILAGEVQDYIFSNWLVNRVKYNQNPETMDVASDLNVVAIYTRQQPPPSSTSEMIVGVNMWSGTSITQFQARDVPLLKQAGIKYVRIGTGVRDSFVDAALGEGIDVIGTFGTTGLPDLEAFGDYVYNRVSHFKGRVNAWVVFNEANYDGYRDDPTRYTQALKTAYTRAKEADQNALIVTSNFLSTESGLSYLKDMYKAGAKDYFDVLGVDPYCYPVPPTEPNEDRWGHTFWRVPLLHDLMVQNGDGNKPVWIVEFGYRTPSKQYSTSHSTVVSEENQAEFLVKALELAQTWPWLERFYIYEWMDSADVDLGYWGLIRENYNAPYEIKPAYNALKQFLTSRNIH